ncbi:hypothetical protein IWX49DRAFT_115311 [Phyllosticta citricarpa]|uniref:Uncharacterized protein n=2 Tax=Phyllosticta TaxID=121621 RepID=A0ABR1MDA3_9PEZI
MSNAHRVPRLLATTIALSYRRRNPASIIASCRPPPVAPATSLRFFSLSPPIAMASDQDYAAFLDKANQDAGASAATAGQSRIGTKAVDTEVPAALRQVDEYLISDADEPFEPVSLKWGRDGLPSEADFARLIGHDGAVATISQSDFDPRGQYTNVVQAVKQASGNDLVGFYRAQHGSTRVEYWVVGVDGSSKTVVGLKAIAVES